MNIGLVGLGSMGSIHRRVLGEMYCDEMIDDYSLFDTNTDAFLSGEQTTLHDRFMEFDEMLDWADGIVIATPTSTHYELSNKVLNAGKALFVEKPFVLDVNQLREFNSLKHRIFVGYIERFNPVVCRLKEILAEIRSFDIVFIETGRVNRVEGPLRRAEGIVADLGVHDFDLLGYLFQSFPTVANAYVVRSAKVDVFASISLGVSGVPVHTTLSWIAQQKRRYLRIVTMWTEIQADLLNHKLRILSRVSGSSWQERFDLVEPARAEMEAFVKMIRQKKHDDDYWDPLGSGSLYVVEEVLRGASYSSDCADR